MVSNISIQKNDHLNNNVFNMDLLYLVMKRESIIIALANVIGCLIL